MNTAIKQITALFFSLFLFTVASKVVLADCTTTYGGGQVCTNVGIQVNKSVLQPKQFRASQNSYVDYNQYVDNIDASGENSYVFSAGSEVKFKLWVKNRTGGTLDKLVLTDIFPSYVDIVDGNGGSWDSNSKRLTFTFTNMSEGQEETRFVTARFVSNVPTGTTCVTNVAEAIAHDDNSTKQSDSSTFCVKSGQVIGITTMPKTGPAVPVALALEIIGFGMIAGGYAYAAKRISK